MLLFWGEVGVAGQLMLSRTGWLGQRLRCDRARRVTVEVRTATDPAAVPQCSRRGSKGALVMSAVMVLMFFEGE